MEDAKFLTEMALKLADEINALWTFHITVAIGAMGWAISSRAWKKGLESPIVIVALIALSGVFAINLWSEAGLYRRENQVLLLAKEAWDKTHSAESSKLIFEPLNLYIYAYVFVDLALVVTTGALLSNLWRGPVASAAETP